MSSKRIRDLSIRVAGSESWVMYLEGTNLDRLFQDAHRSDQSEYGSGGYSGTIGQAYGVRLHTRTPQLRSVASDRAWDLADNAEKRGFAGAIPVAEQTLVGREKELTLKVKARSSHEALTMAKEKAASTVKVRSGATLDMDVIGAPHKLRDGGIPPTETEKLTGKGYIIVHGHDSRRLGASNIYRNKAAANAALKNELSYEHRSTRVFTIYQVWEHSKVTVTGDSDTKPTWEVKLRLRQVKLGKIQGYMFYGRAGT